MLRQCSSSKQARRPDIAQGLMERLSLMFVGMMTDALDDLERALSLFCHYVHNTMPCLKAIGSFVNELDT